MKKLILVGLLLFANSAWAVWLKIGESEASIIYGDPNSVRIDGPKRKAWAIEDRKARSADGSISLRIRYEMNCNTEAVRVLSVSTYSELMAEGKILTSIDEATAWKSAAPNTPEQVVLKAFCEVQ
jgi:hypothetical protein